MINNLALNVFRIDQINYDLKLINRLNNQGFSLNLFLLNENLLARF
jgi:hypothetical protein